jgi:hypothetical protein
VTLSEPEKGYDQLDKVKQGEVWGGHAGAGEA